MATGFRFEDVIRAASPEVVLASYYDASHLAAQDAVAGLVERTVTESVDDGQAWRATWRVVSTKPLPAFVRAFVAGGRLAYLEQLTWRRASATAELVVTPQILGGRVELSGRYALTAAGPGTVRRVYTGEIRAAIPLIGGKVERGILAEFEAAMPAMTACTQRWLDEHRAGEHSAPLR